MRVSGISNLSDYDTRAKDAVSSVTGSSANLEVTKVGDTSITIDSKKLGNTAQAGTTDKVAASLAKEFKVPTSAVASNFIGPSWGSEVTHKAIQALIVFLVLVSLLLAVYFRTWKMALSALGRADPRPGADRGHLRAGRDRGLTGDGHRLPDDPRILHLRHRRGVRQGPGEHVNEAIVTGSRSYAQAANYAVNQTLVRSINTSVVAHCCRSRRCWWWGSPCSARAPLLDLALALFIGIAVGTYSSIFIATPLLASLRSVVSRR